nr:MAG TPA: hypothetical protein [Caudoviricetes sp.]
MKKLLRINQRTYLFNEDTDEQITLLDGDHLILFLVDDYNRLNDKLEKILSLYESQQKAMTNLIKVIKLNNEEIKKIRKDCSK